MITSIKSPLKTHPIRLLAVAVGSAIVLSACGGGGGHKTPTDMTELRIVHASVDAPKVKIMAAGSLLEAGKAYDYKESTPTLLRNPGSVDLVIKAQLPAGKELDVINSQGVKLAADQEYEVFAIGGVANKTLEPFIFARPDKFNTANVRVSVAHLTEGAPMVDVYVTAPGASLVSSAKLGSFAYKGTLGPVEIPEGNYQIRVTASGSTTPLYDSGSLSLKAGDDWMLAAIANAVPKGAPNKSPIGLLLMNDKTRLFLPSKSDGASVRVVHNSADAPAVDIVANNHFAAPLVKNLAFPDFTGYLTVPAAMYNIKVAAAGTQTSVINADLDLANGAHYSVIAVDKLAKIAPLVLADKPRSIATEAQLRVIHGSSLAGNVDIYVTAPGASISQATPALKTVNFKADSGYLSLSPGDYAVTLTAPGSKTAALGPLDIELEAGGVYTILARDEVGLAAANVTLMDDFVVE